MAEKNAVPESILKVRKHHKEGYNYMNHALQLEENDGMYDSCKMKAVSCIKNSSCLSTMRTEGHRKVADSLTL